MVTENHAIYQNNEWTYHEKKGVEPVEPVLKNIYRKGDEKKQVEDQKSCMFERATRGTSSD